MRRFSLSLDHALDHSRRLLSRCGGVARGSMVFGALLLVGSTVSVVATTNTAPEMTSLTLSALTINEGDTVTLTGTFTDPDVADGHNVLIYWHDYDSGPTQKQKILLAPGQLSFQVQHTYTDGRQAHVTATVYDRQLPADSNDNVGGPFGWDSMNVGSYLTVNNVAPSFVDRSVKVAKARGTAGTVVVEGQYTDPGADTVTVVATWGDGAPGAPKAITPCSVNLASHTFRCTHAYSLPSLPVVKSYAITLKASDGIGYGDGGEDTFNTSVQFP
jgi:hypothetical protein